MTDPDDIPTAAAQADQAPDALASGSLRFDRASTAERVADTLGDLISRGELPPGAQLREQQLVNAFDVSRNTLREAFRLLAREGLVTHHMHRGVAVAELDDAAVHDIFRTREPLELMGIEYSAHAPRAALAQLVELCDAAEEAAAEDDWKRVATLNIAFHQHIADFIGSERIGTFFRRIGAELRLAFAMVEHQPPFLRPFIARNHALAALLVEGDRASAATELKAYLAEAERLIRGGIADRFAHPDARDGDPAHSGRRRTAER
jgi:DNA-binding GntR family transcriptional regulator